MWNIILQALIKQIEEHPEKILDIIEKIIDLIVKVQNSNPALLEKLLEAFKPKG